MIIMGYSSPSNLRVPCVPEFFAYFSFFKIINPILNSHGSPFNLVFCNSVFLLLFSHLLNPSSPLTLITNRYLYFVLIVVVYFLLQIRIHIINFVKPTFLVSLILYLPLIGNRLCPNAMSTLLLILSLTLSTTQFSNLFNSRELKDLVCLKNKAHATFDPFDYQVFSRFRTRCKRESRNCYRDFLGKTEFYLTNNPNKFWNFVHKSRSTCTVPKIVALKNHFSCN